jgi:hypothetical protein
MRLFNKSQEKSQEKSQKAQKKPQKKPPKSDQLRPGFWGRVRSLSSTPDLGNVVEGALRSIEARRPMGLISLWRQSPTTKGVLRPQIMGAGINSLARQVSIETRKLSLSVSVDAL